MGFNGTVRWVAGVPCPMGNDTPEGVQRDAQQWPHPCSAHPATPAAPE